MDKLIKEEGFYIGLLLSTNKKQRIRLLQIITTQQLRALVELIYNALHGYSPPHEKYMLDLRRHRSIIRHIVKKKITRRKRIELISKHIGIVIKLLEYMKQGIVLQWRKSRYLLLKWSTRSYCRS